MEVFHSSARLKILYLNGCFLQNSGGAFGSGIGKKNLSEGMVVYTFNDFIADTENTSLANYQWWNGSGSGFSLISGETSNWQLSEV